MLFTRLSGLCLVCLVVLGLALATVRGEESETTIELGFEQGDVGSVPSGWFVPAGNWKGELIAGDAAKGDRCAKLSLDTASDAPFGNLMRIINATEHRKRKVKLTAQIRVEGEGARAMMWLRVDRKDKQMGFFDNMGDRPITNSTWTKAVIKGDVAADAEQLALGVMSFNGGTVFIDDMQLSFLGEVVYQSESPPKELNEREVQNLAAATRLLAYLRFFHPSDEAMAVADWDLVAVAMLERAESADDAAELAHRLQTFVAPLAPGLQVWAGGVNEAPPQPEVPKGVTHVRYWIHHGAGLVAVGQSIYSSSATKQSFDPQTKKLGAPGLWDSLAGKLTGKNYVAQPPSEPWLIKSLGGDVSCRLPVMVFLDGKGSVPRSDGENPWTSADTTRLTVLNRFTRMAGVAKIWGIMQHFYPYFDVVDTNWDAALTTALESASVAADEDAHGETLRGLVGQLHDGHGGVTVSAGHPMLPMALDWSGDVPIVIGRHPSTPADVKLGDVLVAINGHTVDELAATLGPKISAATEGWRRYLLSFRMLIRPADEKKCLVRLRRPDGTEYDVAMQPMSMTSVESELSKPGNGDEIAEGIVYFDLNGAGDNELESVMTKLEAAKGIVFDLRGYPGGAAMKLLPHLNDGRTASAQWNIPVITMPDGQDWQWQQSAWDLPPRKPRLKAKVAFLTDGRAISYAESIMGIVEHYQMGEIVGSTTAGTNGNVNPFEVPGGFRVAWTGMKVLKHDGSQHHGVGIKPTVPITPTPAGIAAGRDEVLEKAIEVLQSKIKAYRPGP